VTERIDHDRLADFVGGALDGTPDASAVRTLIESDPGWAAAHADLVAATAAVSADLRSVGSRPNAVPEDVAARLDGLFRQLEPGPRAAGEPRTVTSDEQPASARTGRADAASTRPGGATASGPRGPGGPARIGPGGAGPGRRTHSRRAKWAAGLSAVAAVIAVGVGFVSMVPIRGSDNATSSGAADSAGGAAAPQSAGGPPPIASGRDYRPGSFAGLGAGQRAQAAPPGQADASARQGEVAGGEPFSSLDDSRANVPPELIRLTGPDARQDCLDAIMRVYGGVPTVVEYARFTGRPALVVLLEGASTGGGRQWIVVAGPDCGLVPGNVDELYNGPLA
jgi:hypothetical protein